METGKKANAALSALGKDYLPAKNAVYLANIHGMPGIGRMFALPKMKKYSHRIILGDDAALIARFPAANRQGHRDCPRRRQGAIHPILDARHRWRGRLSQIDGFDLPNIPHPPGGECVRREGFFLQLPLQPKRRLAQRLIR